MAGNGVEGYSSAVRLPWAWSEWLHSFFILINTVSGRAPFRLILFRCKEKKSVKPQRAYVVMRPATAIGVQSASHGCRAHRKAGDLEPRLEADHSPNSDSPAVFL